MSIYKSSSLAMIPTAYKDGKLYSIRPTDGSGDFTFSRGSNLAATRVDVNGLIEKGRENLNIYSDPLDAQKGSTSYASVTYQDNYNWNLGSLLNNAIVFVDNSTTRYAYYNNAVVSGTLYTLSVFMIMDDNSVPVPATDFLIVLGGVSIASGYSVEDYGNNVYRVSVYGISGASNTANGILKVASNSTKGFRISGFQVEQGLVATPYIKTTGASTAQAGILEDMPRLDYSGGATCPSLLLEPQRTNLFTQSEYFDSWVLGGITQPTLTANYSQSPEGLQNAYRVQLPNIATDSLMAQIVSHTSGTDMTISAWVKSASGSNEVFKLYGDYGTPTGRSSQFTATSEWQRFTFTFTPTATGSRGTGLLSINNTASDLLVYAMQIETASYPTSYIPTYGSSVTRSQEGAQVTSVSDLIGQTQGTLFAEVDSFGVGEVANRIFGVSNGASAERVIMLTRSNGFRFIVTNSSVNNVDYTKYTTTDGVHKLAMTYDANEVRIFVDGVKVATDPSVTLPSSLNSAHIGKQEVNGNYGNNFGGSVKQSLIFPTALTDSECIALTTL